MAGDDIFTLTIVLVLISDVPVALHFILIFALDVELFLSDLSPSFQISACSCFNRRIHIRRSSKSTFGKDSLIWNGSESAVLLETCTHKIPNVLNLDCI